MLFYTGEPLGGGNSRNSFGGERKSFGERGGGRGGRGGTPRGGNASFIITI